MASFCLPPSSIFFASNTCRQTPIRIISKNAKFSKTHLSDGSFIKRPRGPHLMLTNVFKDDKSFQQEELIAKDEEVQGQFGGLEATLNHLSKWLVTATMGFIVIWRHDAKAMWILTGSALNNMLSVFLKQVLNQDRPVSTLNSDPGMPSSHAQCLFFAAAIVTVLMMEGLGVNTLYWFLSSLVFAIASYLTWLRVSQKFHTVSQVVVGAILGSAFSVIWIWTWGAGIQEAYISHLWVRVALALCATGIPLAATFYDLWLKD